MLITVKPQHDPYQSTMRFMPEIKLANEDDKLESMQVPMMVGDRLYRFRLINIFGSWCYACLVEHETLMALKAQNKVELIGVAWRDSKKEVLQWLEKNGNPYHAIRFDPEGDFVIEMGVTGAPEIFIIDEKNAIIFHQKGPLRPSILSMVEEWTF